MNEIILKAALLRLVVVVDRRTGEILRLADTSRAKTLISYNSQLEAFFVIDPKNVELKNAL